MSPSPYNFTALLHVFQYLSLQDLLQIRRVCTTWRDVADDRLSWRTVRISCQNCQIRSVEVLADMLQMYRTMNLKFCGSCLSPDQRELSLIPRSFPNENSNFLKRIELRRIRPVIVEELARMNPELRVMNAIYIQSNYISLNSFAKCANLQKLRLHFDEPFGCVLDDVDLSAFQELKHLRHLSLTGFHNLNRFIDVISCFSNLESLELGRFMNIPNRFELDILPRLHKLEKLRLESILENSCIFPALYTIKNMPKLQQLELINVNFQCGFTSALSACINLKKLMIICVGDLSYPICSAADLESTLTHFVLGVTLEQLTNVNAIEGIVSRDNDVLKLPVRLLTQKGEHENFKFILHEAFSLSDLESLLPELLPTTQLKLIRVNFVSAYNRALEEVLEE